MATWFLLLKDSRFVGYRKTVGGLDLFSREGAAFSGEPIDYDRALPETSLRTLSGQRVFHGDVVEVGTAAAGQGDFEERLVLLEGSGNPSLARRKSGRLEGVTDLWPDGARATIRQRRGSIYTEPFYRKVYGPALGTMLEADEGYLSTAVRLALAVCLGGLASAGLQLAVSGSVGPLASLAGSALLVLGATLFEARAMGRALRSSFLGRVAPRAAAMNAAVFGGAYVAAGWGGLLGQVPLTGAGVFAAAMMGLLTTLALVAMAGSTIDHYVPSSEAGPGESLPGPGAVNSETDK